MKNTIKIILLASLFLTGCSLDKYFKQPQLTVIDYSVLELPGDETKLDITVDIKNMDSHDGNIKTTTYRVNIEGINSEEMTYSTPFNETVRKTLTLTLKTTEAAKLLDVLNTDSNLNYTVSGHFTADTFLGEQTLTIDVSGTATVKVGLNDFFEQPYVTMDEGEGFVITSLGQPYIPFVQSEQPVEINVKKLYISNRDPHSASVKKVIYKVNIEEKELSKVIFEQTGGNNNFALIRSKGDKALFNHTTAQMKAKWNIKNKPLANFMPTILLKAKDFATEITIFNATQHRMQTESEISNEHITNNKTVRQTLISRGITPENLPPEEEEEEDVKN